MKVLIVNRFFGGAQIPTGRMAEDVARVLAESGHEVTALASTGTYAGAEKRAQHGAWSREQGGNAPARDKEAPAQHGTWSMEHGGEDGVAVGRCCGEAVGTEQPKNRTEGRMAVDSPQAKTEPPGPSGTLRVETVAIPEWMPRALAWLWFTWQARKRIPQMDWDVCVLMTDPPLLPLLARRAARRRDQETKRPRDEELKAASDENRGFARWPQGNRVTSDECTETEHQARQSGGLVDGSLSGGAGGFGAFE
jgi:hypothetical protein